MPEQFKLNFSPEHRDEKPHQIKVNIEGSHHEDDDEHTDVREDIGTGRRPSKEEAELMKKALRRMN